MTARYATRGVLLYYLTTAGEARNITAIIRHMQRRHGVSPGATRTQLWRLCQAGLVERVGVGEYRVAPARMS